MKLSEPMKLRAFAILVVIAAALAAVRHSHFQHNEARAVNARLTKRAAFAGPGNPARHSRRPRHMRAAEAESLAKQMIDAAQSAPADESPPTIRRRLAMLDGLHGISEKSFVIVRSAVENAPELSEDQRSSLLLQVISALAEAEPKTALKLLSRDPDFLEGSYLSGQFVSSILVHLANSDPAAALRWREENCENFPALDDPSDKTALLAAIATMDPTLAFSLIEPLKIPDFDPRFGPISSAPLVRILSAANPASVEAAWRSYLMTLDGPARMAAEKVAASVKISDAH